ncbi:MAG: HAMP domain-containing sensor histidine kinase [Planctomycetota bacterium]
MNTRNRDRRPITLRAPVTLGVVMIVLVVILTAVWISGLIIGVLADTQNSSVFIGLMVAGTVLLVAVLAGVIMYLTLSVKAFQLNRRQSNFIDSVTHELKSPIASLKLYLQTMARHDVSASQQAEFHRIMGDDVERLDSLINHLLDTARIERGEKPVATDFELQPLLEQAARAACLRHKLVEDTVKVDCPNIILNAPSVQVEIMFRNLIDNAVKYGGSPPRVRVEASCDESGSVIVSISDNGDGIPANRRRKIFGRFVRLGNELERSRPGTGLGLYLVRNITHAIGGRINVVDAVNVDDSVPPTDSNRDSAGATDHVARGTRFDITLPHGRVVDSPQHSVALSP